MSPRALIIIFAPLWAALLMALMPSGSPMLSPQPIRVGIVYGNQIAAASGTGTFGAEASGRVIAVGIVYSISSSGVLSSMTIGGVSATMRQSATLAGSGSNTLGSDIWTATVPTGASGTVTATPSTSFSTTPSMAVWSIYNASSEAGSGASNTATGATQVSASLTVPANGFGIGNVLCNAGSATSISWTNLAGSLNSNWTGAAVHGGGRSNSVGAATITSTCDQMGNQMLAVNAWSP